MFYACASVRLVLFFELWPYVAQEEFVLCFAENLSWKIKIISSNLFISAK